MTRKHDGGGSRTGRDPAEAHGPDEQDAKIVVK